MAYFNLFFLVFLGLADRHEDEAVRVLWDLLIGEKEGRGFILLFFVVVLSLFGVLGYLEWVWFVETFKQYFL